MVYVSKVGKSQFRNIYTHSISYSLSTEQILPWHSRGKIDTDILAPRREDDGATIFLD